MTQDNLFRIYERQYGPFTHMSQNDKAIWVRYLEQGGAQFAPFSYDVRVGYGLEMPPTASAFARSAALALTRKRIDVICTANGVTRIIEVKFRAGPGAIGQLLAYRELWLLHNDANHTPELMLVTDRLQPDMVGLLTEFDIRYTEVGL